MFVWIMCLLYKSYNLGKACTRQTCLNHECQRHHLWHPLLFFFYLLFFPPSNCFAFKGICNNPLGSHFPDDCKKRKKKKKRRKYVCAFVAYLRALQSTTIMIDMLEDVVAVETQKYKMPCIRWQMETQLTHTHTHTPCIHPSLHISAVAVIFGPTIFRLAFHTPSAPSYLSLSYLSDTSHSSVTRCPYFIILVLSRSCTPKPGAHLFAPFSAVSQV